MVASHTNNEDAMIPNTAFTVHAIEGIKARTPATFGAPLILNLTTHQNTVEITLFLGDQILVDRLVELINKEAREANIDELPPDACPHEAAAYEALKAYGFPEIR